MTAAAGLNIFQKLVMTWEAVHPYNAAQVVSIDSSIGADTAQAAWKTALQTLGLGKVRIDGKSIRHEILNGQSSQFPVRSLPERTNLAAHLASGLNRPFDNPDEPPYRAFLMNENGASRLGIIYRHCIADSVSIRRVMQSWCEKILGLSETDVCPLPAAPGYWQLFAARRGELRIDQTALDLFRAHMRFRRVRKIRDVDGSDHSVGVVLADDDQCLDRLRVHGQRHSATIGEILLAALCEASSTHIPLQARPRRKDVAVGTIVDLRPHVGRDLSRDFGLLLGFTHVYCRPADLRDWNRLLRVVSAQVRSKRDSIAQCSGGWMLAALAAQRLVRTDGIYRFYRKEIPLAAGLSNVNLNGSWAAGQYPSPINGYLRVSPTGPMAPVALSVTTLGSRLHLALTYRQKLLSDARAQAMLTAIIDRLARL